MNSICFNGKFLRADAPVLMVDNKSYRYGDGLFETMKVVKEKIPFATWHFERLFSSLDIMGYQVPASITPEKLQQQVLLLCQKNKCEKLARVRLSVFRGNGGIYGGADELEYTIECWPLGESVNQLNENGFVIDVFPDARKSCDVFSNIKSANYLPYIMAARFAKENKLNDSLVMNVHDRIADASIANIFLVKNSRIITPSLNEGCIKGVMRRYVLEECKAEEAVLTIEDLLAADEIFLTNAVNGVRWVKEFRNKQYNNLVASKIHSQLSKTIWT